MNSPSNYGLRAATTAFSLWARTGRAPGILYSLLEKHGHRLQVERVRRLANGLSMSCDLLDHVQRQIYFFGAYEPIELSLFRSLITPGSVAIDAGANVGFYTLMLADAVGERGRVHAFEPVPGNFQKLERHVRINGLSDRVRLQPRALWHKDEILEFGISERHRHNCGGFNASAEPGKMRRLQCPATTLDAYVSACGETRVDAIKMDIEGAELFALRGAATVLARHRPVVLLEVCRATCEAFGYEPALVWEIFADLKYRIYRVGDTHSRSGWAQDFSGIDQQNVLLLPGERIDLLAKDWCDKEYRRHFLA